MGVQDVDIGELKAGEGGLGAFDEVFAADAEIVNLVAGFRESRIVGPPVDLVGVLVYAGGCWWVRHQTLVETTMSFLFQPKCLMARPMTFSDSPLA